MQSSVLKSLNRLADFVNKFDTPYLCLISKAKTVTSSAPQPRRLRQPIIDDHKVTLELSRLAHEALQFDSVYRVPRRSRFIGHSPRPSGHDTSGSDNDRRCLTELNRLAQLAALCPAYPVYPRYSPVTELFCSRRLQPLEQVRLDQLARKLKLDHSSQFTQSFPGTAKPTVRFFSGQPRIEKSVFNDLLKSKLQELRSTIGVSFVDKNVSSFVVSRINRLLCDLKRKKTSPSNPKPKHAGPTAPYGNKTSVQLTFVAPVISASTKARNRATVVVGPSPSSPIAPDSPPVSQSPLLFTADDVPSSPPPVTIDLATFVSGSPEHLSYISECSRAVRVAFANDIIENDTPSLFEPLREYASRVLLRDLAPKGFVPNTPRSSGLPMFTFLDYNKAMRIKPFNPFNPGSTDQQSWTRSYYRTVYEIVRDYHAALRAF
jgi:hypothetical protein